VRAIQGTAQQACRNFADGHAAILYYRSLQCYAHPASTGQWPGIHTLNVRGSAKILLLVADAIEEPHGVCSLSVATDCTPARPLLLVMLLLMLRTVSRTVERASYACQEQPSLATEARYRRSIV
jgi:hypothetical protein